MKKEALIEATLFSKFLNLIKKDHSQRYKGPEGKKTIDFERSLKKSWKSSRKNILMFMMLWKPYLGFKQMQV